MLLPLDLSSRGKQEELIGVVIDSLIIPLGVSEETTTVMILMQLQTQVSI